MTVEKLRVSDKFTKQHITIKKLYLYFYEIKQTIHCKQAFFLTNNTFLTIKMTDFQSERYNNNLKYYQEIITNFDITNCLLAILKAINN
jgi:hypothetical protein